MCRGRGLESAAIGADSRLPLCVSCERRKFFNVCTTADPVASNRGLSSGPGCFRCRRDEPGGLPLAGGMPGTSRTLSVTHVPQVG
jgi:hypothetical protein